MRSPARRFYFVALVFALLTMSGLVGLDRLVAEFTAGLPRGDTFWNRGTGLLDLVLLKEISNFLLGAILLLAGGVLLTLRATRPVGRPILYLGLVQFIATTVADLAKPQLGRLRPFEAMAEPSGLDTWFVGANSFPSGHTAFYAGLFFPLMLLLPRWLWLWAVPPMFVAVARVLAHDHYMSDVAASLALAAFLTAAFAPVAAAAQAHAPIKVVKPGS